MVVEKIGDSIRNYLEQASEAERQSCLAQLSKWCASLSREKEDREKYAARVARGEPAPSTYTPPYACTPAKDHLPRAADTDTTAGQHTDKAEAH